MMMKELLFHVQRHLKTYPGGPETTLPGILTVTVYLRPVNISSEKMLQAYNGACAALEAGLSSLLKDRLILGHSQKVQSKGAITRLSGGSDCASLGDELIQNVCPNLVSANGFVVEKLKVSFGVFEKATCFPDKAAEMEYCSQVPLTQ